MLKWFDSFCRENGLTYYALGGTVLGAVRHEGFIPWDDDVDVGMPRRDYDRLAELMGQMPGGRYCLETPYSESPTYCYPFSKLYDTTTTLIEHKRRPVQRGVFLDIFPLDGLGTDRRAALRRFRAVQWDYRFFLTRVAAWRKGRRLMKNLAAVIIGAIPRCMIDDRRLRIRLDARCRTWDWDTSVWGGSLLGAGGEREVLPRELFGEPKEYRFEDMWLYGPEDAEGYLCRLYGDWRRLPPEERRVSHHDFLLLDLDRPYREGT